ncbi:transposable element Tcb2 transposase [Trichonephila clavipes]|nr:transposable element Tcb2 transposase [Trichonephila clavipes]
MSSRHHINDFMRGRIIGKIEEGRKITDVAREFDIAHSVVSRLWKSFNTTECVVDGTGEVMLEVRRLQKTDISSCQQKGTDESRFSLSSDCRRQLICRESGTAYRPENIPEKDRYPTCNIMVWAGIMINGRTRLHVVANGTMTGQRYIDEVLLPHVRLFRGAVGDKSVFMDDKATCHRTLAVQDCLDSEGIQRLVWPARSPDLNPIENVWDALGRQVAGRNYPPTNKNTLLRALTGEWDKLPEQLLDNVVQINAQANSADLDWFFSELRRSLCNLMKITSRVDPRDFSMFAWQYHIFHQIYHKSKEVCTLQAMTKTRSLSVDQQRGSPRSGSGQRSAPS